MKIKYKKSSGFTVLELLIVIAIISLLSTIVIVNVNQSRQRGQIAAAKQQVRQLANSVALLYDDTGRLPFGCPLDPALFNSCPLSGNCIGPLVYGKSGLTTYPSTGSPRTDPVCLWIEGDLAEWKGPYISVSIPLDPWGREYFFDADYVTNGQDREGCLGGNTFHVPAIVSAGPTTKSAGSNGWDDHDCDDIVFRLDSWSFIPDAP